MPLGVHERQLVLRCGLTVLGAGAAYALWRAWYSLQLARLIEDTPTAKARSAPQGYVELEGRCRPHDDAPLIAPLSGLPCVWFRYRVEEREEWQDSGRRMRSRWKVIERGCSTETFWLEDDTGRVLIDPEGAAITPRHRDVWESRSRVSGINYPAAVRARLALLSASGYYRFTEERIHPRDPIYAIGLLRNLSSHTAVPTVDEAARALLREWKRDQAILHERFDLNRDGRIDHKEWMLARAQARREAARTRRTHLERFTDGINLLGATGDPRRPFLLSAYSQPHLTRRLRVHAGLCGAGFFLLGIAAVWLFNTRFQ